MHFAFLHEEHVVGIVALDEDGLALLDFMGDEERADDGDEFAMVLFLEEADALDEALVHVVVDFESLAVRQHLDEFYGSQVGLVVEGVLDPDECRLPDVVL